MRIYLALMALCCLVSLASCHGYHSQNIKVVIQESDGVYAFSAAFPENKTAKIHRVVNNSMSPNGLFASANDYMDVTTTLADKTNFAVKVSPGNIRITVKREGNSPAAYDRVKDMCQQIRNALKD